MPKEVTNETRIRARFIGLHGSLGFRRGLTYTLKCKVQSAKLNGKPRKNYIVITDWSGVRTCPYESKQAFLRNWSIVKGEVPDV